MHRFRTTRPSQTPSLSGRASGIAFHAANNALYAFEREGVIDAKLEYVLNIVLIIVVLGGYVLYLVKKFPIKTEEKQ